MPNRPIPPTGEIVLYQTDDGRTRVECRFADETLWMSQALMAELFQTTPQNITLHLKALYSEGEILETTTCKEYLQVRSEGAREVRRTVKHYSLDAILGVGYRIRSERGTQFRRWATERLREYLVKGFTMDDQRLPRQLPQHIWQNAAIPVILHFLWRVYPHHHGELLLAPSSPPPHVELLPAPSSPPARPTAFRPPPFNDAFTPSTWNVSLPVSPSEAAV